MRKKVSLLDALVLVLMPLSVTIMLLPSLGGNELLPPPLAITVLLIANVLLLSHDPQGNVLFLAFQGTFFIFLVAGPLFSALEGEDFFGTFVAEVVEETYTCYWIAAFALWCGCFHRALTKGEPYLSLKQRRKDRRKISERELAKIRQYTRILFYIAIVAYVLVTFDKILYRRTNSLLSYYAEYSAQSNLPWFVVKIADCHLIALGLFLAARPSRKEAQLPLILFSAASALTLFYGVRNVVILNALFLLIYFVMRNRESEVWLSKKTVWIGVLLLPLIIVFLQAFDLFRRSVAMNVLDVREFMSLSLIGDFFASQSISAYILPNAITYFDLLGGQPVPYTFGTLYTYLTQNMIVRLFTGAASFSSNSVESAMYGANLGSRLAYNLYRESYLAGTGMGGSYVADLFVDFSYPGIFLGTLLIHVIAARLTRLVRDKNSSPYLLAFGLVAIRWFGYLPRDSFFAWAMQSFSFMNILFVLAVLCLSRPWKFLVRKAQQDPFLPQPCRGGTPQ